MVDLAREWVSGFGLDERQTTLVVGFATAIAVALLAWLADVVAKRVLVRMIARVARRTKTDWDDALIDRRVFNRLAHLAHGLRG